MPGTGTTGADFGRSGLATHQGRAIPNTLEEIVDPAHTAVIVHEMVRDIVDRYEPAQIEQHSVVVHC